MAPVAPITCGNLRFIDFVVKEAIAAGVPAPAVAGFEAIIEQMVGRDIGELLTEADEFVESNEARIAARQAAEARGRIPDAVEGYLMEDVEQPAQRAVASDRGSVSPNVEMATTVTFAALLLAVLAVWQARQGAPA